MMATAGSMPYVKGRMSAMLMEGEIPGKAPPKIPQATPNAAEKIAGVVVSTFQAMPIPVMVTLLLQTA
jgi:hypothetical protein